MEKKKKYILIFALIMTIPINTVQRKAPSFSAIQKVSISVLELFPIVEDLLQRSTETNMLEHLNKEMLAIMETLKTEINSLFEKNAYKIILTQLRDKIDACEKDYLNYVQNASDTARNNLLKCREIMLHVRPLGNYLSGKSVIDTQPLLELYIDENGVCNETAINKIVKYLLAKLIVGCNIAIKIEELENKQNEKLHANECRKIISNVINYVKFFYNNCAPGFCKTFHCSVKKLFSESPPTSPRDLHEKLSEMYPSFNFLIFQFSDNSKPAIGGTFFVKYDYGHWTNNSQYVVVYFNADIQLTTEKHNYSLAIEVPQDSLIGNYFGNSSLMETFYANLANGIFSGFAPENNTLCVDKITEDPRECNTSSATSKNSRSWVLLFLVFFFFLP